MIIADMLIRCDYPHYKAVRFENGQRVSWSNKEAATASCEAIRLPPYFNQTESFNYFEIVEISLPDYWDACDRADWFSDCSDDHRVWARGGGIGTLEGQSLLSSKHRRIYEGFKAHVYSGPAYKTERAPKPNRPDAAHGMVAPGCGK